MKNTLLSLLLLSPSVVFAQDWSGVGKRITFSDTLKNAKKYTDMDEALKAPAKVYHLEIYIDKAGKEIEKFSANTTRFTNIRKLVLMNRTDSLFILPDSIGFLNKLEYLDLFNFPNSSITGIKNLQQLKYLNLDGFGLKEISPEILELKNLEYLNLSCNFLTELPDSIIKLKNLKEIELTNNCLVNVPVELSQLEMLEFITMNNAEKGAVLADGKIVCDNIITEVPSFFQDMKNLKSVNCFYKVNVSTGMKKKIKSAYPKIKFS